MPSSLVPRSSSVFTVFGWSPALCELIASRVMSCGCSAGTYRTWRGGTIAVVDACGVRCANARHQVDRVIWSSREPAAALPLDECAPFADTP